MIKNMLNRAMAITVFMFVAALLSAIVGLVMAVPVMLLWNWIMPGLTNGFVTELTYIHAWGLVALVGIMFSSSSGVHQQKE